MTTRLRLLLLALVAASVAAYVLWPEPEEPNWVPNPNYVRRVDQGSRVPYATVPAVPVPRPAAAVDTDSSSSGPPVSDEKARGYGVLAALDPDNDMVGSFYLADAADSSVSLEELGFIRGSALLDSTVTLHGVGGSAPRPLRVAVTPALDSALHRGDYGCVLEVPVKLRGPSRGPDSWRLAFADPSVETVLSLDSMDIDPGARADALRLLELSDSSRLARATHASLALHAARRFNADSGAFLIAEGERRWTRDTTYDGRRSVESLVDQRALLAERAVGTQEPYVVVWSVKREYSLDPETPERPSVILRLGPRRWLTLVTHVQGSEGSGNRFFARLGPHRWKEIASWFGGC